MKMFVRESTLIDGQKVYRLTFNCPHDFDPKPYVLGSDGVLHMAPLDASYKPRHIPVSVSDFPGVAPDKRLWMVHLKRGLTDHDAARLAELIETHINEPVSAFG